MIVRATWEFEVDVEDLDPKFIDIPGLAKDLTRKELECLLQKQHITVDDFEYSVAIE